MSLQGFLLLIFCVFLVRPVLSSSGDESIRFRTCVSTCQGASSDEPVMVAPCVQQSYVWDCQADCRYRCMWSIEKMKRDSGKKMLVEKYFGKWPFVKIGPIQEPASVLMSVVNMLANAYCLKKLLGIFRGKGHAIYQFKNTLWMIHFVLAIHAWIWSSVFHSRDVLATERLDYFSAGALMVFDMYLSCCRVLSLSSVSLRILFAVVLIVGYARHIYFMHFVKFDYGYHVGMCVAAGVIQSVAWILWLLCKHEGREHPGKKYLGLFVVAVNAAVLLEVLDFPPLLDTLDAHALWHLATIPLTFLFYEFVARDVQKNVVQGKVK